MPEKPRLFTEKLHELHKEYLGPKTRASYERELAYKLSNPRLHDVLEQKMRATSSVVYNIEELLDRKIPEQVKSELIKKEILNSLVARVNFNVTYDKYKLVATPEERKYYDLVAKYLFNIILGILKRGGTRMPGPVIKPSVVPLKPIQKPSTGTSKPISRPEPKPTPRPESIVRVEPRPTPKPIPVIRKEDVHRDFVKALEELVKDGIINQEEAEQKARNLQGILDRDTVENAVRYGEQVIIALRKRAAAKQEYPALNQKTKRTVIDPRDTTSRIANYPEKENLPVGEHEQIVKFDPRHQEQLERMRIAAERLKQQEDERRKKVVEPREAYEFPKLKARSKEAIERELLKQMDELGFTFVSKDGVMVLLDTFKQKVVDKKDLSILIDYFYEIEKKTNGQIDLKKFIVRDNIQSFIQLLKAHNIKNFLPVRTEKIENANYFIGPTLPGESGRNYCLIYVTANGETKPVVYYRSKSTVGWRVVALRGSSKEGGEEYLNKSNEGEEALALPWELQKILDSKTHPVGDKNINAKYFAPFIGDHYFDYPNRWSKFSKASIIEDFNALERVEQDINASTFGDQQKRPVIRLDSETRPNFSKVLSVWESNSALYGRIKKVAVESKDGKLVWVFNVTPEGSYVNTVQIKQHDVSKYGCASVPEFFGEFDELMLSNPLREYHVQTLSKLANAIVAMELKSSSARYTEKPIFVKQLNLFKVTLKAHAEELASKLTPEFRKYLIDKYGAQFSTNNPAEIIEKYTLLTVQEFVAAKKAKDEIRFKEIVKTFKEFKKRIKSDLENNFDTYSPELRTLTSHPFLASIQDPLRRIANGESVVEKRDASVGISERQRLKAEQDREAKEDAQEGKLPKDYKVPNGDYFLTIDRKNLELTIHDPEWVDRNTQIDNLFLAFEDPKYQAEAAKVIVEILSSSLPEERERSSASLSKIQIITKLSNMKKTLRNFLREYNNLSKNISLLKTALESVRLNDLENYVKVINIFKEAFDSVPYSFVERVINEGKDLAIFAKDFNKFLDIIKLEGFESKLTLDHIVKLKLMNRTNVMANHFAKTKNEYSKTEIALWTNAMKRVDELEKQVLARVDAERKAAEEQAARVVKEEVARVRVESPKAEPIDDYVLSSIESHANSERENLESSNVGGQKNKETLLYNVRINADERVKQYKRWKTKISGIQKRNKNLLSRPKVESDSFFERILSHFERDSQERKEQNELSLEKRIQKVFSQRYGSGTSLSLVEILDKPIDFEKLKQIKNPKAKAIIELLEFGLKSGYLDVDAVKLFLEAFDKLDWMSEASIYANLTNKGRLVDAETQTEYITSLDEFARLNNGKSKDGFMQFNLPKDNNSINTRIYLSLNPKGDPKRLFSALVEALESSGLKDKLYFKCSRDLSRTEQVVFYLTDGIDAKTFESFLLELVHKLGPENLSKEPMLTGIELIPGLYLTEELNKIQIMPRRASYNETISALVQMSIDIAIAKHPEILETRDQQLLRKYASKYFEQFCFMCGLDPKTMLEHDNVFANTLLQSFKSGEFAKKLNERRTKSSESKPDPKDVEREKRRVEALSKLKRIGTTITEKEEREFVDAITTDNFDKIIEILDKEKDPARMLDYLLLLVRGTNKGDHPQDGGFAFIKDASKNYAKLMNKLKEIYERNKFTGDVKEKLEMFIRNHFGEDAIRKPEPAKPVTSTVGLTAAEQVAKAEADRRAQQPSKGTGVGLTQREEEARSARERDRLEKERADREAREEAAKPKPVEPPKPEPVRLEPQPIRPELPQEERELIQHTLARLKEITGREFSLTLPEMVSLARTARKNAILENNTSLESQDNELALMNWRTNGPIFKINLTRQHRDSVFVITDRMVYEHKHGKLWGTTNIAHEYNPQGQDRILGLAFIDKDFRLTTYAFGETPKGPEPPKPETPKVEPPKVDVPLGPTRGAKPVEPKVKTPEELVSSLKEKLPEEIKQKIDSALETRKVEFARNIYDNELIEIDREPNTREYFIPEGLLTKTRFFLEENVMYVVGRSRNIIKVNADGTVQNVSSDLSSSPLLNGKYSRVHGLFMLTKNGLISLKLGQNEIKISKEINENVDEQVARTVQPEPKVEIPEPVVEPAREPARAEPKTPVDERREFLITRLKNAKERFKNIEYKLKNTEPELVAKPEENDLIDIYKEYKDDDKYYLPEGIISDKEFNLKKNVLYVIGRFELTEIDAKGNVKTTRLTPPLERTVSREHGMFILTDKGLVMWRYGRYSEEVKTEEGRDLLKIVPRDLDEKSPIELITNFIDVLPENIRTNIKTVLKEREVRLSENPLGNDLIELEQDPKTKKYFVPAGILTPEPLVLDENKLYVFGRTGVFSIDNLANRVNYQNVLVTEAYSRTHGLFMLTKKGLIFVNVGANTTLKASRKRIDEINEFNAKSKEKEIKPDVSDKKPEVIAPDAPKIEPPKSVESRVDDERETKLGKRLVETFGKTPEVLDKILELIDKSEVLKQLSHDQLFELFSKYDDFVKYEITAKDLDKLYSDLRDTDLDFFVDDVLARIELMRKSKSMRYAKQYFLDAKTIVVDNKGATINLGNYGFDNQPDINILVTRNGTNWEVYYPERVGAGNLVTKKTVSKGNITLYLGAKINELEYQSIYTLDNNQGLNPNVNLTFFEDKVVVRVLPTIGLNLDKSTGILVEKLPSQSFAPQSKRTIIDLPNKPADQSKRLSVLDARKQYAIRLKDLAKIKELFIEKVDPNTFSLRTVFDSKDNLLDNINLQILDHFVSLGADPSDLLTLTSDLKLDVIKLLIEKYNANVSGNQNSSFPLLLFSFFGNRDPQIIEYLLSKGANLDLPMVETKAFDGTSIGNKTYMDLIKEIGRQLESVPKGDEKKSFSINCLANRTQISLVQFIELLKILSKYYKLPKELERYLSEKPEVKANPHTEKHLQSKKALTERGIKLGELIKANKGKSFNEFVEILKKEFGEKNVVLSSDDLPGVYVEAPEYIDEHGNSDYCTFFIPDLQLSPKTQLSPGEINNTYLTMFDFVEGDTVANLDGHFEDRVMDISLPELDSPRLTKVKKYLGKPFSDFDLEMPILIGGQHVRTMRDKTPMDAQAIRRGVLRYNPKEEFVESKSRPTQTEDRYTIDKTKSPLKINRPHLQVYKSADGKNYLLYPDYRKETGSIGGKPVYADTTVSEYLRAGLGPMFKLEGNISPDTKISDCEIVIPASISAKELEDSDFNEYTDLAKWERIVPGLIRKRK